MDGFTDVIVFSDICQGLRGVVFKAKGFDWFVQWLGNGKDRLLSLGEIAGTRTTHHPRLGEGFLFTDQVRPFCPCFMLGVRYIV